MTTIVNTSNVHEHKANRQYLFSLIISLDTDLSVCLDIVDFGTLIFFSPLYFVRSLGRPLRIETPLVLNENPTLINCNFKNTIKKVKRNTQRLVISDCHFATNKYNTSELQTIRRSHLLDLPFTSRSILLYTQCFPEMLFIKIDFALKLFVSNKICVVQYCYCDYENLVF